MTPRRWRSKVDLWLAATLVAAAAVVLLVGVPDLVRNAPGLWPVVLLLVAVAVVLPLWILLGTWYELDDRELRIRSGPFRWRIPVATIRAVVPTRSPLSSPALSLDRLRIEYGRGEECMISPTPREDFLRALEAARALHR